MSQVKVSPLEKLGHNFIPSDHLPAGEDEFYLRNQQNSKPKDYWRKLRADEIEVLVKNANSCDDWTSILVADPFTPQLIRDCEFSGLVRIGKLERVVLEHHDLTVPAGISNSLIISSDLGDNVAIHGVTYLSHYIIGDSSILLNVDEMNTTNHAKFGNGIVKEGEDESVRIWMDIMNEVGGRSVMPFDGMIPADAYMWAKYRDDSELVSRLGEITQRQFDSRRGFYGVVGDGCVIKNSRILKDVKIGANCYIKGANKLKNLTINSNEHEPTQIGESVELVNGIVGLGCHVFYGCKAVRFVMGNNAKLKYGARLIHSFLGDNSTVSCCELLNNLIYPAHEQHHNNSFLIAGLVMGQSNMAAGATIGSNHNSRGNDGEVQAGRGFWPGLCVTLTHPSRFASFVLLAKGSYPAELDISLPFSLVNNDGANDRLTVMPAYWWMYNMYALARNSWKFESRDRRRDKIQHVEFESLAPDTIEEIRRAMELLEVWTAKAHLREQGGLESVDPSQLPEIGRRLLLDDAVHTDKLDVRGEEMENSRRKVVIVKPRRAYHAYRQMLHHYSMRLLLEFWRDHAGASVESISAELNGARQARWVNFGGQILTAEDADQIRSDIRGAKLTSWQAIHQRYDDLWDSYPRQKQCHALATLLDLLSVETLTEELWVSAIEESIKIQQHVCEQVYLTRKKDFDNPFRSLTFRNAEEMRAVLGSAEDNGFVKQVREETEAFRRLAEAAIAASANMAHGS